MDALRLRLSVFALWSAGMVAVSVSGTGLAATYQTRNFSVTADRPDVAEKVGQAAESYRRQLAIFWLGQPLPNWSKPCKLRVREGALGAGGQTTFQFVRGEVLNWDMSVQGTLERILDSVLPHEVNHTIFACHFRRPLPRWADEGAATLFEHRSEQLKQLALLNDVISNDRERFSLQRLLSMKDYPDGMRPMLILYAQGYALADFLVQQKGRQAYLKFLSDGEKLGWDEAIRVNFDHEGVDSLERNWKGWVLAGMPKLTLPRDQMLAAVPTERSAARAGNSAAQVALGQPAQTSSATAAHPVQPRASGAMAAVTRGLRRQSPPTVRSQSPESAAAAAAPVATVAADNRSHPAADATGLTQFSDPRTPRRLTIQAPRPATAPAALAGGPQAATDTAVPDAATGRSAAVRGTALEHTGKEQLPQFDSETPAGNGTVSEFESVHLPRERNVVSGSTPEWAGFPGQKKLF